LIPDIKANFLSRWTLQWINPLVNIGYTRPLVAEDLYKLDDARAAKVYAEKLRAAYAVHVQRTTGNIFLARNFKHLNVFHNFISFLCCIII
jgi:hypothetical protein